MPCRLVDLRLSVIGVRTVPQGGGGRLRNRKTEKVEIGTWRVRATSCLSVNVWRRQRSGREQEPCIPLKPSKRSQDQSRDG